MSDVISVFGGSGYVLGEFCKQFKNTYIQRKEDLVPHTNNILWGISTTHNYHVFSDVRIDIYTNQVLLVDMLENARRKFGNDLVINFISSWFVYGKTELPARESNYCDPKGFYSITKRASEQMLISYCESYKINYRILRLANVLGVVDKNASLKKNAVQFLIQEITNGKNPKTYNSASIRDFIDVRDCAKAINLVITRGNLDEIYNIGNGVAVNVREILRLSRKLNNITDEMIEEIPVPEFHQLVQGRDFWMETSRLKSLGYSPEYTITDTVSGLVQYFKNEA